MEEKTPMIYAAICGAMEDIGAVGKNDTNRQQGFKYRSIDAVMNALNPAMVKHKIFCTPEVVEQSREERNTSKGGTLIYSVCRIRYRFFTTDGSHVDAVVVGEGMDSGDKATSKAMSAAFKYACFHTFCIPTENLMDEPDADMPEPNTKKSSGNAGKNGNPEKGTGGKDSPGVDEETLSMRRKLEEECRRTGVGMNILRKSYTGIEKIGDMSKLQLKDALARMARTPDKAVPS